MAAIADVKRAFRECLTEDDFISLLQAALAPAIALAVAEVKREKDREIKKRDQEIRRLSQQLTAIKQDQNDLEQYSRRNCIVISGVSETAAESTDQLAMDIGKAAGVAISPADIDRSHRIGIKKPGQVRQLIVKLTSFNKRQELFQERKNLRSGRLPNHPVLTAAVLSRTYLADSLSKQNSRTMFVCRQLKRKGVINRTWSDNGVIKIKVRDGDPTKKIRTVRDLYQLAGDDPDVLAAMREEGEAVPVDDSDDSDSEAGDDAATPARSTRSQAGRGRGNTAVRQ